MRWRYGMYPYHPYTVLGLYYKASADLQGYAAIFMQEGQAICVDLFAGNPNNIRRLLFGVIRAARERGADSLSISITEQNPLCASLGALGFRRRNHNEGVRTLVSLANPAPDTHGYITPLEQWHFMQGDEAYI